mmetsp:Transcript_25195/g.73985  ORF Transcript_25195/g.73985 Transcript_25195/m.73985 type:complete len:155 (-) Transcript_25195:511-975(-)
MIPLRRFLDRNRRRSARDRGTHDAISGLSSGGAGGGGEQEGGGAREDWERGLRARSTREELERKLRETMPHSRLMWMSAKNREGVDDLMGRMAAFVSKVREAEEETEQRENKEEEDVAQRRKPAGGGGSAAGKVNAKGKGRWKPIKPETTGAQS